MFNSICFIYSQHTSSEAISAYKVFILPNIYKRICLFLISIHIG